VAIQFKAAVVQAAPVLFDRRSSPGKACRLVDEAAAGKFDFDVTGHYAHPDIFQLSVDEHSKAPLTARSTERE
jgi:hypothetical protein